MRKWQPISTAPRDGTTIVLWSRYALEPAPARWQDGRWMAVWDGASVIESQSDFGTELKQFDAPTHWQHQPEPPQLSEDDLDQSDEDAAPAAADFKVAA